MTQDHDLIRAREYQPNKLSLKYPAMSFRLMVHNIMIYVGQHLPSKCHSSRIVEILVTEIMTFYDTKELHCPHHDEQYTKKITNSLVTLLVNHWCCDVNRILHGKRLIEQGEKDPIKKMAHLWHTKHSKKKITKGKFNLV